MITDKQKKIILTHLGDRFKQGSAILFTGAGFSHDCKNFETKDLPLGESLRKLLWPIAFPDQPFSEDSTLPDIFAAAKEVNANLLTKTLKKALSIDPSTIPNYYSITLSAPWLRVYTLNIDDLPSAANRGLQLPRQLKPISATSTEAGLAYGMSIGGKLDVIHLNGTLDDLPDNVTFAPLQYADRAINPDAWYAALCSQLLSHAVVFIGSQLDEGPLWQHILLRRIKGERGLREMRPRSYLVKPSLDPAREALLSQFNVMWIPATSEEFAREILSELGTQAQEGLEKFRAQASRNPDIPEVENLATNPGASSEFLLGEEPIWADIQSGRAIEREHDQVFFDIVSAGIARRIPGVVILTGTAGSGKSTALMRAALRLSAGGQRVGWLDKESDLSAADIRRAIKRAPDPQVICVDDADLLGHELPNIAEEIHRSGDHRLIVMSVRSGKAERIISQLRTSGVPSVETSVPHLTDSDIDSLLRVLEQNSRLGKLRGLSVHDQRSKFSRNAGRQLLVAMLVATSGEPFRQKPAEELRDMSAEERLVYATVCVASTFRISLSRSQILLAVGRADNSMLNALDGLTSRHILSLKPDGSIRARHRMIAELVFDELQKGGEVRGIIEGLAFMAATEVNDNLPRGSKQWRLLRALLNHEFLVRTIYAQAAQAIYPPLETVLSWDSHYWLQRGSLEVEFGSLPLAENFLSQAKNLAPTDALVETEWAYLLFRKALERPTSTEAPALVEDAVRSLEEIIRKRGSYDSYPYHVLGSQGLAWARRAPITPSQRQLFLDRILLQLDRAKGLFAFRPEIQQLWADVRREQLSSAVLTQRTLPLT